MKQLSFLCEKNGISVTALCKEITGSSGNLSTWKNGNIRTDYLIKIADRFNCSVDYLLDSAEAQPPQNILSAGQLHDFFIMLPDCIRIRAKNWIIYQSERNCKPLNRLVNHLYLDTGKDVITEEGITAWLNDDENNDAFVLQYEFIESNLASVFKYIGVSTSDFIEAVLFELRQLIKNCTVSDFELLNRFNKLDAAGKSEVEVAIKAQEARINSTSKQDGSTLA